MGSSAGLLLVLAGFIIFGYGLYCAVTMTVVVGFRYSYQKALTGMPARGVGISYMVGSTIMALSGFLAWTTLFSYPEDRLALVSLLGFGVAVVGHLVGTILSVFKP